MSSKEQIKEQIKLALAKYEPWPGWPATPTAEIALRQQNPRIQELQRL
jgi:hypothetical protein